MQQLGECSTLRKSLELFGRELFSSYTGWKNGILLPVYKVTENGLGRGGGGSHTTLNVMTSSIYS